MTVFRRTFIFAASATTLAVMTAGPAPAEDPPGLEARIGEVFHRSMTHWRYDYAKMPTGKAGVACIPWQRIDATFLDAAIFDALGFAYSVATAETAINIATQGCEQMKAHYRLSDCACEVVLIDDAVAVTVPPDAADRLR